MKYAHPLDDRRYSLIEGTHSAAVIMPAEEILAHADPVSGSGDPPEPLVVLIAAVGPRRVDGAFLI